MQSGEALAAAIGEIEDRLRRARADSIGPTRTAIDTLFGSILTRTSGHDDVMRVEGARILCFLYLSEVESGKRSAGLQIALNSLRHLREP